MPVANSEVQDFLKPGLDISFFKMFDTWLPSPGQATIADVTTPIGSTSFQNVYAALGSAPMLAEQKGELALGGINTKIKYTIDNVIFSSGLEIDKKDLMNDQYGQILLRAGELGVKARLSLEKKAFTAIHDGGTNLCYDGKALFADDHELGQSGAQDNNLATALDKTNLKAAIKAMQRFKDDNGEPAGITPDLLLVNPALFTDAWELVNGTSIVLAGTAGSVTERMNANGIGAYGLRVAQSPWFLTDTEWYLVNTRAPVKPVILQERTPIGTEMSDKDLFSKNLYYYKAEWYGNTGYYDWRNILRGNA